MFQSVGTQDRRIAGGLIGFNGRCAGFDERVGEERDGVRAGGGGAGEVCEELGGEEVRGEGLAFGSC